MVDLLVVAPADDTTQHAPTGFIFADEIFTQAGWKDKLSADQAKSYDLRRTLAYLVRRFPHRIKIHWVDPMSLRGLYLKLRFRLRSFPAVLVFARGEMSILTGEDILHLVDVVGEFLSKPDNSFRES